PDSCRIPSDPTPDHSRLLPLWAPAGTKLKTHRGRYERGFESRDVRPQRAVLCGVRDHVKADCGHRDPGGARLLPKAFFRYAGMRLACLGSSVRRRQATAATWRHRVRCEFDECQIAKFVIVSMAPGTQRFLKVEYYSIPSR